MEGKYANIIVDISHGKVDRPFQYRVPEHLLGKVEVGMLATFPFGKGNTQRTGYIIEITNQSEFPIERLKELSDISSSALETDAFFIQLAEWIKMQYGSTMIASLKAVLPVKEKVKIQEKKEVILLLESQAAQEMLVYYKKKNQKARVRLLEELQTNGRIPYELVVSKLHIGAKTMEAMCEAGVIQIEKTRSYRNPNRSSACASGAKKLSCEQQEIVTQINDSIKENRPEVSLLHGITGSGKTQVYIEIIREVLGLGKQAIVLIPEIALTYQMISRFSEYFGEQVSFLHSRLSKGERFDQMERAKEGEISIMIGPRSALFTPFQNLGVIVVDEEHEPSYKSETSPKYHAVETAIEVGRRRGAAVVLGSATPSMESYYRAKKGEIRLHLLKERLTGGTLPTVYVEDLREELKRGNRSIFSNRLQEGIAKRLESGEQVILFLNRRGYAGFVSCRSCGQVMKCLHCDVSLSEHRNGMLVCHYCGYQERKPERCPKCSSTYLLGFKAGTQQVEEILRRDFPSARILRMDGDTTKKKDSYHEILSAFAQEEADILIGTQMIVKGHDFSKVTLVGILAADLSLAANDYRAGERTFQLLVQAAGRAGRGELPGEVVIQTYQPEHYSIQCAASQDYERFFEEELLYRELLRYPPAAHMLAILVTAVTEEEGWKQAEGMKVVIREYCKLEHITLIGPAKATVGKINDVYRYMLYCKHTDKAYLILCKDKIETYRKGMGWKEESIQYDFNPMNSY